MEPVIVGEAAGVTGCHRPEPLTPAEVPGGRQPDEGLGPAVSGGQRNGGGGAPTPAKILVVEDEQIVALELKDRLTHMGHSVVGVVGSGEEAIEHARRLQPDLVLMDIKLQGEIDGIQAAEGIHQRLRHRRSSI